MCLIQIVAHIARDTASINAGFAVEGTDVTAADGVGEGALIYLVILCTVGCDGIGDLFSIDSRRGRQQSHHDEGC